jgi:hypothetical protein
MADPVTDAAIAARFPREWARANDPSLRNRSKARQQLRQRYRHQLALDALMLANPQARCSSCAHVRTDPSPGLKGTFCDLDSDFEGYARVAPDFVCTRWRLASVDTRRMAETGTGSGRSPSGAVRAMPGDAQPSSQPIDL